MSESNLYLIGDVPGFTPQIGRLVSMMNHVRVTTLSAVAGLDVDELDYIYDPQSNSIGALLSHIAAAEVDYQAYTFYARDLTKEERDEWSAALDLGERARCEIRVAGCVVVQRRSRRQGPARRSKVSSLWTTSVLFRNVYSSFLTPSVGVVHRLNTLGG